MRLIFIAAALAAALLTGVAAPADAAPAKKKPRMLVTTTPVRGYRFCTVVKRGSYKVRCYRYGRVAFRAHLPRCKYEDQWKCVWEGDRRGNKKGKSILALRHSYYFLKVKRR